MDCRREFLASYQAQIDVSTRAAVRPAVVNQMLAVPYVSQASDRALCSHLYAFAAYVHGLTGDFVPGRDLTEANISAFVHVRRDMMDSSRSTVRSNLRRIRDDATGARARRALGTPAHTIRTPSGNGHRSRRGKPSARTVACREDFTLMADLTGEAGLRAAEATRITGVDISRHRGVTVVEVHMGLGGLRVKCRSPARPGDASPCTKTRRTTS